MVKIDVSKIQEKQEKKLYKHVSRLVKENKRMKKQLRKKKGEKDHLKRLSKIKREQGVPIFAKKIPEKKHLLDAPNMFFKNGRK